MKKKLFALAVLLICAASITTSTLAYFTARERADNVITTGRVGIELIERTKDSNGAVVNFPTEGIKDVMPGSSVSKIVSVDNTGTGEAWIRILVEAEIIGADGDPLPLEITAGGQTIPVMAIQPNTADWIAGDDGYYYYRTPVQPEASTTTLFEEVHFAKEMGNEYQKCTANVYVSAQAVQSANNPIPDGGDVTDVDGWPQN